MSNSYEIIKNGSNSYAFTTKNKVDYQFAIKPSGIIYENSLGKQINVLELSLNCEINTACKDYKTLRTIIQFGNAMSQKLEAVYLQMHNQPELLNKNKVKRRGLSRYKLWTRIVNTYCGNFIMLSNQMFDPDKDEDIFCIAIKKDSIYFKQIVRSFYRFCK